MMDENIPVKMFILEKTHAIYMFMLQNEFVHVQF